MRTTTFKLFSFIFFTLFASFAFASELTFSEALGRLYTENEKILAAGADVSQKEIEKKATIGLYFPQISINAAYMRFNDNLNMDVDMSALSHLGSLLPVPIPLPSKLSQKVQDKETFALEASVVWPIFTGGKIYAANSAAKLYAELAGLKAEEVKDKLGAELVKLYFGARLSYDAVKLRKEFLDDVTEHYNKAQKLENRGMISKVERMHAEVALADAERAYNTTLRESRLTNTALNSILNAESDVMPLDPLFILNESEMPALSSFQKEAPTLNAQLKQLGTARELTSVAIMKERSTYFPEVFLFGMKSIYDYQVTSLVPDWTLGVGVNFKIFEGLSGYHKVQAAKAAQKSIEFTKRRAEKDINTLIEEQYITMENALADYSALQKSLAFTEEYLRARRKAFDNGLATSLDVVDAELQLSSAKLNIIMAAYKFDVALAKFLESSGRFDEFESFRSKATINPEF